MKKVMLLVAACAAMVACNNGKTTTNAESKDSTARTLLQLTHQFMKE